MVLPTGEILETGPRRLRHGSVHVPGPGPDLSSYFYATPWAPWASVTEMTIRIYPEPQAFIYTIYPAYEPTTWTRSSTPSTRWPTTT